MSVLPPFTSFPPVQQSELLDIATNIQRIDDFAIALLNRVSQLEQQVSQQQALLATIAVVPLRSMTYDLSGSVTASLDEMNIDHNIDATGSITFTLPAAVENCFVNIFNGGTGTVAVSDGTNTLCSLTTNSACRLKVFINSDGVPVWPTAAPTESRDGKLVTLKDVIINSTSVGVIRKDTNGHYWRDSVNTSGALVTSDLGTSASVITSDLVAGAT